MSVWFFLILVGGFVGLGLYLSYQATLQASNLFRSLEKKYALFASKVVEDHILRDENQPLDIDKVQEEVLIIIKPELEGILAHINSTTMSGVKVAQKTSYFPNLARISEELYRKRNKDKNQPISQDDRDRFYAACQDAILSDLTQRKINLRLGNI